MSFLPQVISARYLGGHRILVRFNDGTEAALDFRKWLRGPVFEPLQDLDQFRRFFVEGGGRRVADRGRYGARDALCGCPRRAA